MTSSKKKIRKTILVVDDDIESLDALAELLETSGYSVVRAQNGQEALKCLKRNSSISLVLLDLAMPVMSGWEFLRQRKNDPAIAKIPVVAISALFAAKPAGTEAVLQKPIQFERLVAMIDQCC